MPNLQKLNILRNNTYLGTDRYFNKFPVFDLIRNGECTTAMEIIAKEKLFQARDNHGLSLLHWAAITNSSELATFLIDHGVNINIRDQHGFTPLHWAARTGSWTVTNVLFKKGADIHAENIYGELAFHWAAWVGNLPFVKYSIHHGIDVNQLTKRNKSALEGALHAEEKEVVKYLTRKGAKPKTSWTLAEWQALVHQNEIEKIKQIPQEAIQGLNQKEIDFRVEFKLRCTGSVDSQSIETVKYLLDHYAATLDYIANCNSIEIATEFLQRGADINKKFRRFTFADPQSSEIENTLLHNAIEDTNLLLIQFALDQGADIYTTNSDNLTPLQLALSKKDAKLTSLFLKKIALEIIPVNELNDNVLFTLSMALHTQQREVSLDEIKQLIKLYVHCAFEPAQDTLLRQEEVTELTTIKQNNNSGGFDQRQTLNALAYLFKDNNEIYVPTVHELAGERITLPLDKMKQAGYRYVALTFPATLRHNTSWPNHHRGLWIVLQEETHLIHIFDSDSDPEPHPNLEAIIKLFSEQSIVINLEKKSHFQWQVDQWSCGVHAIANLYAAYHNLFPIPDERLTNIYAAYRNLPPIPDEKSALILDTNHFAQQFYRAHKAYEKIAERKGILAELQDRYKRSLLNCIETQRIKDCFYQRNAEDSKDLLKPIADFLQLALWGNLDRKFPLDNQSGRQNQSNELFRTQTLAASIEVFRHDNQLASEIGKCILRIAHIYAENKHYAAHLSYLLQLIMDAYTAPELKKHEQMIDLLNTEIGLKFSSLTDEGKYPWLKLALNNFIYPNFSESVKLETFLEGIESDYFLHLTSNGYQFNTILFGLIKETARRFTNLEQDELAKTREAALNSNNFITQLQIQRLKQNGLAYLQENLDQVKNIEEAIKAVKLFAGNQKWEAALLLIDKIFKIDFDATLNLLQHLSQTPATATQLGKLYHQFPPNDWIKMSQTLGCKHLQSAFTCMEDLYAFTQEKNDNYICLKTDYACFFKQFETDYLTEVLFPNIQLMVNGTYIPKKFQALFPLLRATWSEFLYQYSRDELTEMFNRYFNVEATLIPMIAILSKTNSYLEIRLQKGSHKQDKIDNILNQLSKLKVAHDYEAGNIAFFRLFNNFHIIRIKEPIQTLTEKLLTAPPMLNQNNCLSLEMPNMRYGRKRRI
jgi:ankyrin repeat protein